MYIREMGRLCESPPQGRGFSGRSRRCQQLINRPGPSHEVPLHPRLLLLLLFVLLLVLWLLLQPPRRGFFCTLFCRSALCHHRCFPCAFSFFLDALDCGKERRVGCWWCKETATLTGAGRSSSANVCGVFFFFVGGEDCGDCIVIESFFAYGNLLTSIECEFNNEILWYQCDINR